MTRDSIKKRIDMVMINAKPKRNEREGGRHTERVEENEEEVVGMRSRKVRKEISK